MEIDENNLVHPSHQEHVLSHLTLNDPKKYRSCDRVGLSFVWFVFYPPQKSVLWQENTSQFAKGWWTDRSGWAAVGILQILRAGNGYERNCFLYFHCAWNGKLIWNSSWLMAYVDMSSLKRICSGFMLVFGSVPSLRVTRHLNNHWIGGLCSCRLHFFQAPSFFFHQLEKARFPPSISPSPRWGPQIWWSSKRIRSERCWEYAGNGWEWIGKHLQEL